MFKSSKKLSLSTFSALLGIGLGLASTHAQAFKIGDVSFDNTFGIQNRNFENNPLSPIQRRHEFFSAYFQQEISYSWNGGKDSWVFTPYFATYRFEDPMKIEHEGYIPFIVPIPIIDFGETRSAQRSYGDIRELMWTHIANDNSWELRTGIGKVFWGVTESQHLVDVINQDDLRADIDREDKLGQPMINFTWVSDYGNFDFFVLPGFRERLYQDNAGRLNPVALQNPYLEPSAANNLISMVDQEADATYESGAEELHTDFAFRWSHAIGASDIGLSFFQGTNRDPVLGTPISEDVVSLSQPRQSKNFPGLFYITPHYEQMTQVGIDYQATLDAWLLKLEAIHRDSDSLKTPGQDALDGNTDSQTTDYTAVTAGFEYTFYSIFDSTADLGVLVEYLWDSRDFEAPHSNQNDVFLGARYAQNSTADPAVLIGIIQDVDVDSYVAIMEASRRLGQSSKMIVEIVHAYADGQAPSEITVGRDATKGFDNEDHVRLAWETYF